MREETVMSLKWHSFPSHLAVSLDTCYEKQQFVDLSLVCKDGTILKCHKMVLANSSSFFRRLLVANEHPHPMIILHDIEADDLKTIINFMYCGEIQVVQSEVRRLLKLAEILEVTGLRHIQTSVLVAEANNAEGIRKTATRTEAAKPTGLKSTRLNPPTSSTPVIPKTTDPVRKIDEGGGNINLLNQRLETGKSGISIVDINDMPSTSRGIQNPPLKRKEPVISWPSILSAISKDKPLPLKKLCIMDEVEITAGKPPTLARDPGRRNDVPLDRRKSNIDNTCAVFIKDEVDLSSDLDDDTEDPLEVEEIEELKTADSILGPGRLYSFADQPFNRGNMTEFTPRKGSNG